MILLIVSLFSTPCNLEGLINITYENTLTTCQYNLLSYENYMKTLWKTRSSDVIWEMILEANNTALVQNARPLAEGIVDVLRNIPRQGSNVVIVPPPCSAGPVHTEPAAVFEIHSLIAFRAELPQSRTTKPHVIACEPISAKQPHP